MIKKPHGAQKQLEVKMKRHGGTKKPEPHPKRKGIIRIPFWHKYHQLGLSMWQNRAALPGFRS